jgi:hypothetical protein
MFCPHLVAVFINLQVMYIPSRYIPKRYTRNARVNVTFDRHDTKFIGPDGSTKASRMLELLPHWSALQQETVMSAEVRWSFIINITGLPDALLYYCGNVDYWMYYWIAVLLLITGLLDYKMVTRLLDALLHCYGNVDYWINVDY